MYLSKEVTAVFEEQPSKVFNLWEIAKHIASSRMRFYRYGWIMRWFARKHPQAAEELMRDKVYDKLKGFDILAIPGVDFTKPPPRLYSVPCSPEIVLQPPPRIEVEIRHFILQNLGKPYTRQQMVVAIAHWRYDEVSDSECPEYCKEGWSERLVSLVSRELRDSSYEKTFG